MFWGSIAIMAAMLIIMCAFSPIAFVIAQEMMEFKRKQQEAIEETDVEAADDSKIPVPVASVPPKDVVLSSEKPEQAAQSPMPSTAVATNNATALNPV
jgi:hypothetical protein